MTSRTHFVTRFALAATTVVLSVLGMGANAWGQTNPAAQSLPYSQDFSGVLWTDTAYPLGSQGWTAAAGIAGLFPTAAPTGNAALLASSSASIATGGVHNYNGKLGLLGSGSANPALTFALNTTGSADVVVNYDVMTIRNPQTGLNGLEEIALQYRVGTSGSFVTLKPSAYQNLTGIANNKTTAGDVTAQNLQARSVTLPPVCDNQSTVQIRWAVRDVSGSFTPGRPGFAIDNVSVSGSSYSPPAAPSDLVARWRMEEGSGSGILDATTNGLNGSTFNAPTWGTGIEGVRGLSFNGTNQYANVPDNALLDLTGTMTLAGWIRPAKQGTQSILAKSTNGGTNGYELTLQTGTAAAPGKPFIRFNQVTSGDTYRVNAATYYPSDGNTWMHLAATYDGSTARIYVNGALDTSVAMSVVVATNALPLGIASQHDGSGARYFQGLLDDMRLYDRALSASEIRALAGLSTHTITASAGANGSIAPSGAVTVNDGANQAFVITPAGGYDVADVLVDGGSVGPVANYQFNSVTADHTIAASFVASTYTLTYTAGPNGSISGTSPQVVSSGGSGTAVTAVPDAGYHFVDWSDGVLTATRTDSNVLADLSVTANFAINQYTLTYTAGANGSISGTSPQTVDHGSSGSAVTAVPDGGYDFVDWSDGVLTATRTDSNVQAGGIL